MDISVLLKIIYMFLIIIGGLILSKLIAFFTKKKDKDLNEKINKGLTTILMKVALPVLIISSFTITLSPDTIGNVIQSAVDAFIFFFIAIIIGFISLFFVKSEKKRILHFGLIFSNCGFMGFPIINNLYGTLGVLYTAIFNMVFVIFVWTYGVILFSDRITKKDIRKLFLNPGLIAVYIGLPLMIFQIKLPQSVTDSMNVIGSTTTPLSMIIIGFMLSKIKLKSLIKEWSILYGTFIKLIIVPLIFFAISLLSGLHSEIITIFILLEAMPVGSMTSIFAESFEKHQEFAAVYVFLSTLLSIATIPLILSIVH